MTRRFRVMACAAGAWLTLGAGLTGTAPAAGGLDVADVSYLWPVATTPADVGALIASDAPTDDGGPMLPAAAFQSILDAVRTTVVKDAAGFENRIVFDSEFETELRKQPTWKVVGFRVDPAAIGHPETLTTFGVMPQLRLILQPVTLGGGRVVVHDMAAHVVFSYATGTGPFAADRAKFQALVDDLAALKADSPAPTTGPLGVHPGLATKNAAFLGRVKAFVAKWTAPSRGRLFAMSFMGIDPPEPWIFFALVGKPDGTFVPAPQRPLGGSHAQMISFRGGVEIAPVSVGMNTGQAGKTISTAVLFNSDTKTRLEEPAAAGLPRPLRREVADYIANPTFTHVFNTDCVSCHTESTRRRALSLPDGDGTFRYVRPAGVSGVDPTVLSVGPWNVRNFGWFNGRPAVSQRAANEAAESLAAVIRDYQTPAPTPSAPQAQLLRVSFRPERPERQTPPPVAVAPGDPPKPVATPLTLVMDIKSPDDNRALHALIEGMQSQPQDQNPIRVALNRLRTVHFARFVFLDDTKLAIITTFDGSFADYIDAFVNTIGPVFDKLLVHMKDAPPLPVGSNRDAFLAYVKAHDRASVQPFYSAYPDLTVRDILTLQNAAKAKTPPQP